MKREYNSIDQYVGIKSSDNIFVMIDEEYHMMIEDDNIMVKIKTIEVN